MKYKVKIQLMDIALDKKRERSKNQGHKNKRERVGIFGLLKYIKCCSNAF